MHEESICLTSGPWETAKRCIRTACDDPEAEVLRQEIERLEQEIEELTEFSPGSTFDTQAESG